MKSTFKLGSIELNGVKLENIEFTQEYSATEAISMINFGKKFMTELIEESPAILESLERAFNKFNEIDARVDAKVIEELVEKLVLEGKSLCNCVEISMDKHEISTSRYVALTNSVNSYKKSCCRHMNTHGSNSRIDAALHDLDVVMSSYAQELVHASMCGEISDADVTVIKLG